MSPVANLKEALTAFHIGYFDELGLVGFVSNYLCDNPELYADGDLAEIASINQKRRDSYSRVRELLAAYLQRTEPKFDPTRNFDESQGRRLLKARLELYLSGGCRPYEVCKLGSPLERMFDWPTWLGDLYNACDWVDPRHEARDCPALRKEAKRLIQTL
jgi:hypothetical protein